MSSDGAPSNGALDSKTGADVLALFRELNAEGRTIVLITHDQGVAALARRTCTMVDGRLYEGAVVPAPAVQGAAREHPSAARAAP